MKRQYKLNEDYFGKICTEEKAYWLGFILADGCVQSNYNGISIELQKKDKEHLKKFLRSLKANYPLVKTGCGFSVAIFSKKMKQDLIKLGVTPRKAQTTKPIRVRKNLQRYFWRGVFDGDGSIHSNLYGISISGTEEVSLAFIKFNAKFMFILPEAR